MSLSDAMQQFLVRTRHAYDGLLCNLVNAKDQIGMKHAMDAVCGGRNFNWFMYHIPASEGVREHVAVHLYASSTDPRDAFLRGMCEQQLQNVIDPAKVTFVVLLHYKD